MTHSRWWGLGVCLLGLVSGSALRAAPAPAAPTPLAQVPADAPIVIQVQGIERTRDRLAAMVANAVPDLAPMVRPQLDKLLSDTLKGRLSKGLAKDGPDFIVVPELPGPSDDKPKGALVARVTSYQDFLQGFLQEDERKSLKTDAAGFDVATVDDRATYFVDRRDFVVVTSNKEVATQFTGSQAGLDGKLSKEVAKKFLEADVAAYVDMAAVNQKYGEQITQFRQFYEVILQQATASGQIDDRTVEMIKGVTKGLFQVAEDSRTLLMCADFRPEGLAWNTQVAFGADTPTNAVLKDSKPSALEDLAKLPAGRMSYLAVQFEPELAKRLQPWMSGFLAKSDSEEGKAVQEALDQMSEAGARTCLIDFSMPSRGLQVWSYKEPAKAAEAQLNLFKTLKAGDSMGAFLKDKPDIKANAQTYRGFTLHSVSMTWDFDKMMAKAPAAKGMGEGLKTFMGEGLKSWFGTDGKRFVQVTAKDWEAARAELDGFLDGKKTIGGQAAFQEARKQLPAQTTMLSLTDASAYAQAMAGFVGAMVKAENPKAEVPSPQATQGKSFLAIAVTLQPEQGSLDVWVPVTAVAEIRAVVEPMFKALK